MSADGEAAAPLPATVSFVERGWLNANVVVLHGRRPVLVDTGYAADAAGLEEALWRQAGVRLEDVGLVLISHAHPDHIGLAPFVRARSGADIAADEETAAIVARWDTRLLWSSYAALEVEPFAVTRVLRDGERVDTGSATVRAVYTPGHSRGGACFWLEEDRLLVSSDTVREGSFGALNPRVDGPDCVAHHLAALDRLEALGPRALLPAHGPLVTDVAANFEAVRGRVAYLRDHPAKLALHLMKVLLLVHLRARGPMPEADVRAHVAGAPWFGEYVEELSPLGPAEVTDLLLAELPAARALERRDGRLHPTMAR
ncbi:MAG TPA: MBL fold metallo-hydrolase [Methylomirabilota bacterium]|nr:MBL fold metallo-hydrolase [Methylomirabilota bacterium]